MTAILKEDPLELSARIADLPPALERTVQHCLEKSPAERFQSARDLAFDLEASVGQHRPVGRPPGGPPGVADGCPWRRARRGRCDPRGWACSRGGSWEPGTMGAGRTGIEPTFTRLTFEQGTVWNARFTPDGETVVYDAAWNGQPIRLFFTRLDTPQSTAGEPPRRVAPRRLVDRRARRLPRPRLPGVDGGGHPRPRPSSRWRGASGARGRARGRLVARRVAARHRASRRGARAARAPGGTRALRNGGLHQPHARLAAGRPRSPSPITRCGPTTWGRSPSSTSPVTRRC